MHLEPAALDREFEARAVLASLRRPRKLLAAFQEPSEF
jgi:hypothetical protein